MPLSYAAWEGLLAPSGLDWHGSCNRSSASCIWLMSDAPLGSAAAATSPWKDYKDSRALYNNAPLTHQIHDAKIPLRILYQEGLNGASSPSHGAWEGGIAPSGGPRRYALLPLAAPLKIFKWLLGWCKTLQALHINIAMGLSQASAAKLNLGIPWISSFQKTYILRVLGVIVNLGESTFFPALAVLYFAGRKHALASECQACCVCICRIIKWYTLGDPVECCLPCAGCIILLFPHSEGSIHPQAIYCCPQ